MLSWSIPAVEQTEIAIIGGGPTGIGAALRLLELGRTDFRLIDAAEFPGGLAASYVDPKGFTWDLGAHVQFSHYQKFDEYMDLAIPPDGWLWHERESGIWIKNRFVPYPFQNNLHRLDPPDRWRAVEGLIAAHGASRRNPANFEQWILGTFGAGIAELFLFPYNRKIWAHPLSEMDFRWVGERVAVPSLAQAMKAVCLNQDQVSWGPNHRFRFPLHGGTGSIWRSLGRRIPKANLALSAAVASIDSGRQAISFPGGRTLGYEILINTAPLDWLGRAIGNEEIIRKTAGLKSSAVHVVGVGLRGVPPEHIRKMCWMYFPGDDSSFYRVTLFSNYSPYNVPDPANNWSLMAEVSETEHAPRDRSRLVEDVVAQMVSVGLIPDPESVISRWHKVLMPGYPTPSLERDGILADVLPALEDLNIYSRGRFGAWKYEVSNQDHSFMQGVEAVDRILLGRSEPTLHCPDAVNRQYNEFPYVESEAA